MYKIIFFLVFLLSNLLAVAQCEYVSVQIASSDTSLINLYNAGFFLIPNGNANVYVWHVTDFNGEIIHQDTTSADTDEDELFSLFNHNIPITDSMSATITITNEVEGIICTISDTLFWEETEISPGSFIGNWAVLSDNGGVEEIISSTKEVILNSSKVQIYPSPVTNYFKLNTNLELHHLSIADINGKTIKSISNFEYANLVDVSNFAEGTYFLQLWNKDYKLIAVNKLLKFR